MLQPLRRTLDRLPAAELTVATPAGAVSFAWQASAGRADSLPRRRAGLWLTASFEASVSIPAGSPPTELRLPVPPGGRSKGGGWAAVLEPMTDDSTQPDEIVVTERGCGGCVVFGTDPAAAAAAASSTEARSGVLSSRLDAAREHVILEIAAGSYEFELNAGSRNLYNK